ncbi:nicotinate-nucleotide--dimethylbenzimidazole phosphoribosyltransferase [Kitasatospora sp. NPDC049285]|uniref:nicotinate-nucleotide--dimethylbenzimidazole phosphoribosyltransferase n=1 Tax=Kitasatospora sp. NPDC049285 TaxID=3157096 RepID=UPI003431A2BA
MTDGGHAPSAGPLTPEPGPGGPVPEHHLGAPLPPVAPVAPAWHGDQRPAYTFLDQPDGDEDDDVLLMPGPQAAWGDAVHGPAESGLTGSEFPAAAVPGTPVAPSWPPLTPPPVAPQSGMPQPGVPQADLAQGGLAQAGMAPPLAEQPLAPQPVAPLSVAPQSVPPLVASQPVAEAPATPAGGTPAAGTLHLGGAAPQAAAQAMTAPQPRRPLHAGPPIPDPSLMTGQVPVRSLADRGPTAPGGTPAYGVPVPAETVQQQPVAVQPIPVPAPVQPQVVEAAAAAVVADAPVAHTAPVLAPPVVAVPSADGVSGTAVPADVVSDGVYVQPSAVPAEAVAAPVAPVVENAPPQPVVAAPGVPPLAVETVAQPEVVAVGGPVGEPVVAAPAQAAEAIVRAGQDTDTVPLAIVPAQVQAPVQVAVQAPAQVAEPVVAAAGVTPSAVPDGQPVAPAGQGVAAVVGAGPAVAELAQAVAQAAEPVVGPVPAGPVVDAAQPIAVAPVSPAPLGVEPVAVPVPAADAVEPVQPGSPVVAAEPVAVPVPTAEASAPAAPSPVPAEAQPVAVAAQPGPAEVVVLPQDGEPVTDSVYAPEAVAPTGETAEPQAVPAQGEASVAAPQPEAPAADEASAVVEEPVQATPKRSSGRGAHRRISAFLAAPAGLPVLEPEAQVTEAQAEAPAQPEAADPQAAAHPQPAEAAPVAEPAPHPAATETDSAVIEAETPSTESADLAAAAAATEPAADTEPGAVTEAAEPAAVTEAAESVEEVEQVEEAAPAEDRGEAAPGYDDAGREAVHQVIRERRDIRNGFRPDPIPHEVLIRVLEAAHTAPSVGYSQPWDFVVIRSAKTRRKMHELAERQREAYADSLPKARAKQFKEIKIEAILETPVNIVVTADRTRGGRHTLGRHTQPQMAPYSAALAVENLWLAARAEGLGVGWVSFFDEEELVRELGLPEHLDVVAYLCVGFVDAFPDEPELQQQGWAKKRPLSWVVHEEQYGNRALPGEEPHDLLSETLRGIRPLDAKALGEAWDRQKRMTKPAGSLGMLEIIAAQLSGLSRKCPPPIPEPACVAIFAGDHGVHAQGVTPWPQEVTAQMVGNFLAGGAVVNAFAAQVGAEVCVVDVGVAAELPDAIQQGRTTGLLPRKVKPGTDDMTQGPAMSREEAQRAIEVGIETARDLVAAGNKVLITGDMGIANTTASAALISVFTGTDPAEVTGRGTGIDDATHTRKVEVIRQALELHRPDPADPIGVLSAIGGLEHAAIAGFLLGAASLRTPVILDGVIAGSAALVAKAIAPEVLAACIAGHRSAEPGHQAALAKLGLRPLIDLDLRLGEGTGALLALPLVQSAARAMHDVATFDSAGVTEKA